MEVVALVFRHETKAFIPTCVTLKQESRTVPIKPKPYIIKCPRCDWEVGVAPTGDVLAPWEYFVKCPECGNESLTQRTLNPLKEGIWRLTGKMAGVNL